MGLWQMLRVPIPSSFDLFLDLHPALSSLPWVFATPAMLLNPLACFDRTFFQKQPVDLFQGEIASLRVAKVHKWNKCKVEGHEYKVTLPRQVIEKCWSDHDNEKVPKPV